MSHLENQQNSRQNQIFWNNDFDAIFEGPICIEQINFHATVMTLGHIHEGNLLRMSGPPTWKPVNMSSEQDRDFNAKFHRARQIIVAELEKERKPQNPQTTPQPPDFDL